MKLRTMEENDLEFIHKLNNDYSIMSFWFEEPYKSYNVLKQMYEENLTNDTERRFIVEDAGERVGLAELIQINHVHRYCEVQLIIAPEHGGKGYAKFAFKEAVTYAFDVLNMHKVMLWVDTENEKGMHIYKSQGFTIEGELKEQFYTKGSYRDAYIMSVFKRDWQKRQ